MSKSSIPKVLPGFFLAYKNLKSGHRLYSTFPIRDKDYYLQTWTEIDPVVAEAHNAPIVPPAVDLPESLTVLHPAPAKKGRKPSTDGKGN